MKNLIKKVVMIICFAVLVFVTIMGYAIAYMSGNNLALIGVFVITSLGWLLLGIYGVEV